MVCLHVVGWDCWDWGEPNTAKRINSPHKMRWKLKSKRHPTLEKTGSPRRTVVVVFLLLLVGVVGVVVGVQIECFLSYCAGDKTKVFCHLRILHKAFEMAKVAFVRARSHSGRRRLCEPARILSG